MKRFSDQKFCFPICGILAQTIIVVKVKFSLRSSPALKEKHLRMRVFFKQGQIIHFKPKTLRSSFLNVLTDGLLRLKDKFAAALKFKSEVSNDFSLIADKSRLKKFFRSKSVVGEI